jgi:DNA-binding response OmpR family regulator
MEPPQVPSTMADRTVLIVEDDYWQHRAIADNLLRQGWRVAWAPDSESAAAIINENPPDTILMDVNIPGTDGLTMVGILRDLGFKGPIVVMTGDFEAASNARKKAQDLELDAVLEKPFRARQLGPYLDALRR